MEAQEPGHSQGDLLVLSQPQELPDSPEASSDVRLGGDMLKEEREREGGSQRGRVRRGRGGQRG